ncbi:hypothetical protein KC367_g9262 [Hortaea werneckii]|nr:hypothetical protein KC367_g9262 [Hortaea werneckii]
MTNKSARLTRDVAATTPHSSADTGAAFRFLDLPPELRNAVYEQALSVGVVHIPREPKAARRVRPPALLHVCRQIRQESSPFYYATNTFCLCISDADTRFAIKWLHIFARSPLAVDPPPVELSSRSAATTPAKTRSQRLPGPTVSRVAFECDREDDAPESYVELTDLGNALRETGYCGEPAIEFCASSDWVQRTRRAFGDDSQTYHMIAKDILTEVRGTARTAMGEGGWAVTPNGLVEPVAVGQSSPRKC